MMKNPKVKKFGVVAFKIGLSLVAFVVAAGLAGIISKEILGLNRGSVALSNIFILSMIIPIWYGAPMRWRITAIAAAIAAGFGTWLTSYSIFFAQWSDPVLPSLAIGFFRAGGIVVSFLVCIAVLRVGRARKDRSQ